MFCSDQVRMVFESFWGFEYYFKFLSSNQSSSGLDRLEYLGQHPLQTTEQKKTLSPCQNHANEKTEKETLISYFNKVPSANLQDYSELMVSQRWNINADSWNAVYTDDGDARRKSLIEFRTIYNLLGGIKGKSILDAGCGTGYLCRLLANEGAKVTGVDITDRFIKLAQRKESQDQFGIQYMCASLTNLKGSTAKVTRAVCQMAIEAIVLSNLEVASETV